MSLVSIGVPVHNGQNYLRQCLDSILEQTLENFEVIISDNASTDQTPAICREYADRDSRIRYYRQGRNLGATKNFNDTVRLARGKYFKWASHDDILASTFLEKCVEVLESRPEVVLCHSRTRIIGEAGEFLSDYNVNLKTASHRARDRFRDMMCKDHGCFEIFGLMPMEILKATRLLGAFVGADRNLLAELSLMGPFHEISEFLFLRREHRNTSVRVFPDAKARLAWFDSSANGKRHFPTLRRAREYFYSIQNVSLNFPERLACYATLLEWAGQRAFSFFRRLGGDHVSPAMTVHTR